MSLPNPELKPKNKPVGDAESSKQGGTYNREYVRIYYPQNCPPKFLPDLIIHYRAYQILDISEFGLRFRVPRRYFLHEDILVGSIKFTDESIVDFSGVVVRREEDQIALRLVKGIPFSIILSEQVRLRDLESSGEISFP
jgi:hypothetical protein